MNEEYTVSFLPTALHDMTEIISSFVMFGSRQGAVRMKEKFRKAASQLESFPYSGVAVPEERLAAFGFRMLVVEKYLMFHRVFEDERRIVVYHVLNGARDYPTLLLRMYEK